jgi:hypothetical protein
MEKLFWEEPYAKLKIYCGQSGRGSGACGRGCDRNAGAGG